MREKKYVEWMDDVLRMDNCGARAMMLLCWVLMCNLVRPLLPAALGPTD